MEDPDDAQYAPQSPDLSAVDTGQQAFEPHPQHREYRGSISAISPFTPTSDVRTPFSNFPSSHGHYPPQVTQQQYHNNGLNKEIPPQSPLSYPASVHATPTSQQHQQSHYNPYFGNAPYSFPSHHSPTQQQQPHYNVPVQSPQQYHQPLPSAFAPTIKQEGSYASEHTAAMPAPRGGKKVKKEDVDAENNAPGVQEGIEVRTKFPVARIKRIMQADEDVGKVAQVTPVVVSKALELFMISLVTKAATQAKQRGSKRVLATHLKQAVLEDDQFDYLQEIVSKVAEAPAKNADKEDSDEAMEGVAPAKKKKSSGAGRKKRKEEAEL